MIKNASGAIGATFGDLKGLCILKDEKGGLTLVKRVDSRD